MSEIFGGQLAEIFLVRCFPAGILAAHEPFQIPFQNSLRRGGKTVIADQGGRLGADDRRRVPARECQFRSDQVQLVFKIRRPGIGGDLERVIVDIESQSDPATSGDLVDFLLPEIAHAAGHQRQSTRPGERFLPRRQAAVAMTKSGVDHDLVALGRVREQ